MNPFDEFCFDDDMDGICPEDIFESLSDAEQVVERAKQGLYDLLKEDIKSTLKEAAAARKELSDLTNKIAHAKYEVKIWEKKIEDEKEKFERAKDFDIPKMYMDRIVRNLTGGFAPGDKAYVIETEGAYKKCQKCNGNRRIDAVIDGETYSVKCPECDGSGSIYAKNPPHVKEKTVTGVYLTLCFAKDRVGLWSRDNIYLDNSEWSTEPKDIYTTREAAEAALKGEQDG